MVGLSQVIFPYQANGSLLKDHEKVVGSELIAQEFISLKYFYPRFSAVDYDAENSGGGSLAPASLDLYQKTAKRIQRVKINHSLSVSLDLPADMVLDSASGLDPQISLSNAIIQLPRVAKNRHLSKEMIKALIHDCLEPDFVKIWGRPGVNVLKLNLALDRLDAT